jgi:fructokinase
MMPLIQPRVAAAGEALIDLIAQADGRFEPVLGGAVFNLARALSRQGVDTGYLNPLSMDRFGRQLGRALERDHVQLARPDPVPQVTSIAVVALDEAGHPDYAFYRQGVADRATSADQLNRHCAGWPGLEVVCTGALALSADDSGIYLPWLREQRARGLMVVVDANLRPTVMPDLQAYRRNVLEALKLANIIKASDEDLETLGVAGRNATDRARKLLDWSGARWLALTLGAQGACLLGRDGTSLRALEAVPIKVADTVGAGDCFLGGLMAAMLRLPISPATPAFALGDACARLVLEHALASASLCVMRCGAVPPTWDEVRDRVARAPCSIEGDVGSVGSP